jgi:hypothetical protein
MLTAKVQQAVQVGFIILSYWGGGDLQNHVVRCMSQFLWSHYVTGPNLSLIIDFRQVSVDLPYEKSGEIDILQCFSLMYYFYI